MKLGEWSGLCKIDQEGNARKVVKCSCAVVRNWGLETPAHHVLQVPTSRRIFLQEFLVKKLLGKLIMIG